MAQDNTPAVNQSEQGLRERWELAVPIPNFSFSVSTNFILFATFVISIVTYIVTLRHGYVTAYNDSRAHMNMARLVVDNLNPGLAQIGSVWLPLDHLLKLILVWQNDLWQSGFAGAIWSMLAYVGSTWIVYAFIRDALKSKSSAVIGALVFALNVNVLYMQSTPMTELPLLFFFTAASYYLWKWSVTKKPVHIVNTALFVFLATFTRYDGWFLYGYVFAMVLFIIVRQGYIQATGSMIKRFIKAWPAAEGQGIMFATLGGFGIALWLIWNKAIFGEWLYFALGPYSAHAQQARIAETGGLFTQGHLLLSLRTYWWAMVDNIGFLLMIFAIIGFLAYLWRNKIKDEALAVYSLLTPMFFHILSLLLGFSILIVPELGVAITTGAKASWFNVRYGLMIIPAVAFFASYLTRKSVLLKVVLIALIAVEGFTFYANHNIITLVDGVYGTSSLDVADVRDWLLRNAQDESQTNQGLILTSISFNNALAYSTGFPLKRFIHEGTGEYWKEALTDPQNLAEYVVMANGDVGDPVYDALINHNEAKFLHYYDLKLKASHTNIYQRKVAPRDVVVRDGNSLYLNDKPYKFIGVNSYDLAYQGHDQIDETLDFASRNGINVVRFWAFGEDSKDGFQPSPAFYNERRLDNLAYVVSSARKHNIKLIITLSNYWPEYGGAGQYLKWAGLPYKEQKDRDAFFTNGDTRAWFKGYVEKILQYQNHYTGIAFKDEPAILSWELMNEPRSSRKDNGGIVTNWAVEMTKFMRNIDKLHMIAFGTEGFMPTYNDGNNGPTIDESAKTEGNDLATVHYYLGGQKRDIGKLITQWKANGKDAGQKPLVLEEVGFDKRKDQNGGRVREESLAELLAYAKQNNVDGVLLWNWALWRDNNFGISPLDPMDWQVLKLIKEYSNALPK